MEFISMEEIKKKATDKFFDHGWGRFFLTRYPQFGLRTGNKIFFVTSEKFVDYASHHSEPRKFTIRALDVLTGKTGSVGEFQAYENKDQANRAMRKLAEKEESEAPVEDPAPTPNGPAQQPGI